MKAREASNEQSDREVVVEIASKPKIKKKVVIVDTVSKKDPQYVVAKLSKISSAKEIILTDEDLKRQEEEKREQIAQIRRKFKEQHKRILMTLLQKNKELEKKVSEHHNGIVLQIAANSLYLTFRQKTISKKRRIY